jgi:hypothetical protein
MELEELLKEIGGKKSKSFINESVTGVIASWTLEDIKGDGVSYNLFRKKMVYWKGYNPNPNGKYFWDISKITEIDDEMEFDNFSFNDYDLSKWLEKEFRTFIRDKRINDILN